MTSEVLLKMMVGVVLWNECMDRDKGRAGRVW